MGNVLRAIQTATRNGVAETLSTTIDSLLGQETGRSFELIYSKPQTFNSQTVEVRAQIHAVTSGAAWNATDNLVTLTRRIQGGSLDLKPMSTQAPDQTLTLYQYDSTASTLTTTVWQGQPDATNTSVISGTKTVTTNDLFGNLLSSSSTDIASNLVLSGQTVTTSDSFGRPTRIDSDDGTYELRSYACCGLGSVTDRTGLTTSYGYDDLGRVTSTASAGLLTLNTFDPDGRLLTVSREGTDNSIIVQQTNTYDLAGRQTSSKDALNRPTGFAETINGAGNTVRTTTTPDNASRITTSAPDGSVLSVTGSAAAQQLSYQYSVDTDGAYTKEIHLGSSGETTEWVKTFTDFAGRAYKTVHADGAAEQSYFNTLGQLVKTTDADGVTTLLAYNGRGEQEVSVLDLNRDGVINYNGTDRVVRTVNDVASHGTYVVQRTTSQVWETDGQDTPTTASLSEQGVDGLHSWQTVRGLTSSSVTALTGSGNRTVTSTAPDGTITTQTFANGRLSSTATQKASVGTLASITYAYDEHGRLHTATDVRNGVATYTYYADDQVQSVTTPDPDISRSGDGYDAQTISYAYDSAGRQNLVTQPDGGIVNTTYWPTGAVKRTWGTQIRNTTRQAAFQKRHNTA